MINPLFAKLFGSTVEDEISKWAEVKEKRARGQASFRLKHSTVDHGITLRHIVEKVWEDKEEVFCCFVDFKKAFETVPKISCGVEWKNLKFLCIIVLLSIDFMKK